MIAKPGPSEEGIPAHTVLFATTHWSVVLAAGRGDTPQAGAALEKLCGSYWYPLYAYVRRRGYPPEDARDLTQEFFARLLQANSIADARREKGRFRSFLLGAFKHLLADQAARAHALKRGGGRTIVSWEQDCAEDMFGREPVDVQSPELLFDRRWALTVLVHAAARLRDEFSSTGDPALFDRLKIYVTADTAAPTYATTASQLGLSESAVKSAIFRLRRRYGELVREEVAQTVADPNELEDEIRHLRSLFCARAETFGHRPLSTE